MFWGCFSITGPGALVPINGMMNNQTYLQTLDRPVKMSSKILVIMLYFSKILSHVVWLNQWRLFFVKNNVKVLDWPGNSPDLNPIENLWAICKKRLRQFDCTTKTKLIEAVIQTWFHDIEIEAICEKLIHSMPKRVKLVIKAKGGHIKY